MDNQEVGSILTRLDQGTCPGVADALLAVECAGSLLEGCRREAFSLELPAFQLLCRLAISPDPNCSTPATNALYHDLIEPLCDDFTPAACNQAHAVLAGLVVFMAATPAGRPLQEKLGQLGLTDPAALLAHWRQATSPAAHPIRATLDDIETILIPSRVSVGADVVITSVLAQRLAAAIPGAEIVLVGPDHLPELFGRLPNVRHLPFAIARHGGLGERLLFWPRLLTTVADFLKQRPSERTLVVDSDSRLTQLGLLPLTVDSVSGQFPSQSLAPEHGRGGSLSALANQWLDGWLGEAEHRHPLVTVAPAQQAAARAFCARLRQGGVRRLLLVNFGVGGEPRKSLPESFEFRLLDQLLDQENTTIILDMGCGSEEKARAEKLLARLAGSGRKTLLLEERQLATATTSLPHGVVGLCSSLSALAALGSEADCYLGYDSCGQHLANGVGARSVTIFAGAPNPRFLARWSPSSLTGNSIVIPVTERQPGEEETAGIISRVDRAISQLSPPR